MRCRPERWGNPVTPSRTIYRAHKGTNERNIERELETASNYSLPAHSSNYCSNLHSRAGTIVPTLRGFFERPSFSRLRVRRKQWLTRLRLPLPNCYLRGQLWLITGDANVTLLRRTTRSYWQKAARALSFVSKP